MYRRKMEKQTSNVKSVRTLMLLEPSNDNKRSLLLPRCMSHPEISNFRM
jgi:hypothetical protein